LNSGRKNPLPVWWIIISSLLLFAAIYITSTNEDRRFSSNQDRKFFTEQDAFNECWLKKNKDDLLNQGLQSRSTIVNSDCRLKKGNWGTYSTVFGYNQVFTSTNGKSDATLNNIQFASILVEDYKLTPEEIFFRLIGFALLVLAGGSLCMKEYKETGKWSKTWMTGAGISLFFAVIALITMGKPTCDDYDGGTCLEYADDGYIATYQQRFERFITVFGVMTAAGSTSMLIYFQDYRRQSKKPGTQAWLQEELKKIKKEYPEIKKEYLVMQKKLDEKYPRKLMQEELEKCREEFPGVPFTVMSMEDLFLLYGRIDINKVLNSEDSSK